MAYVFQQYLYLGPKLLDSESQPSLNGSPQNLHTSFIWDQALKPTFKKFFLTPDKFGRENLKFHHPLSIGSA